MQNVKEKTWSEKPYWNISKAVGFPEECSAWCTCARKIKLFKVQSRLHKFRMFWYMRIKLPTDPKCTYTEFLLVHWTVVIFLILTWLNIQRWVGMDPNTFWLRICGKYGSYFRLPYSIVLVWAPDSSESSPQTDQSTSASGICLCGIYHLFKTPFLRTQRKATKLSLKSRDSMSGLQEKQSREVLYSLF